MPYTDAVELSRCDDCKAVPVMGLGWDDDGEGVLVLACNCDQTIILTDIGVDETPVKWK